jgi:hypothetical protein
MPHSRPFPYKVPFSTLAHLSLFFCTLNIEIWILHPRKPLYTEYEFKTPHSKPHSSEILPEAFFAQVFLTLEREEPLACGLRHFVAKESGMAFGVVNLGACPQGGR